MIRSKVSASLMLQCCAEQFCRPCLLKLESRCLGRHPALCGENIWPDVLQGQLVHVPTRGVYIFRNIEMHMVAATIFKQRMMATLHGTYQTTIAMYWPDLLCHNCHSTLFVHVYLCSSCRLYRFHESVFNLLSIYCDSLPYICLF